MRAWRFHGYGDMRLDNVPEPQLKPGYVLARVRCVQPSVTEAVLARGGDTIASDRVRRAIDEHAPVQLFGHEYTAEVLEIGEGVKRIRVGDRVVGRSLLPCGTCRLCTTNRRELCVSGPAFGIDIPGCFADYAAIPEEAIVAVPESLSDSQGACVQALAECIGSVEAGAVRAGDTVVVIGQGGLGLMITQVARTHGARQVIAIDVRDAAIEAALSAGADVAIDASREDALELVREATSGLGAEVVIETAGGAPREGLSGTSTLAGASRMARDGGCVVMASIIAEPVTIDFLDPRVRSIDFRFPPHQTLVHLDHGAALIASGRVRVDEYITHRVSGLERVPEAFEITANKARYGALWPCQVDLVEQE